MAGNIPKMLNGKRSLQSDNSEDTSAPCCFIFATRFVMLTNLMEYQHSPQHMKYVVVAAHLWK